MRRAYRGVGASGEPPNPLVLYAPLTTSLDATIGTAPTGTAINATAISGGYLDCTGGTPKGVYYAGSNISSATNRGCVRFKFKPNYDGNSAGFEVLFSIGTPSSSNANTIEPGLFGGNLYMRMHKANGDEITTDAIGAFAAQSGVEVEMEFNWNETGWWWFVDGVQLGSTGTGVTGRDGTATHVVVGNGFGLTNNQDASFRHFRVFNSVQHTANYTPS